MSSIVLGMLLLGSLGIAAGEPGAEALERCRSLRNSDKQAAQQACHQALLEATVADTRFELRMHLADLAVSAAHWSEAEQQLRAADSELEAVGDPLARHRLLRRRGMLEFRRGALAHALSQFLQAKAVAIEKQDARAQAISENDLGIVYRQLGEDREALSHWLASLQLKREAGELDLAATEDNLGNLYRDLGEFEQAEQFLRRAIEGHRAAQRSLPALHSEESLAVLEAARGEPAQAQQRLQSIWQQWREFGTAPDRGRVAQHLARLALDRADLEAADHWLQQAGQQWRSDSAPLTLSLLRARALRLSGHPQQAVALLRALQPWPEQQTPEVHVEAWRELSSSATEAAEHALALSSFRAGQEVADRLQAQRHDQRMNALRVRFELAEVERERSRLQQLNAEQSLLLETRRRQLVSLVLGAVLLSAALILWFQRRLYRQRLASQAREANERMRAERAIREAEALRADLRSIQLGLDEAAEAMLVIDASGQVRSANQRAAERLRRPLSELLGLRLNVLFNDTAAEQIGRALDMALDAGAEQRNIQIDLQLADDQPALRLRVLGLSLEEELGVLALEPPVQAPDWVDRLNQAHSLRDSTAAGSADAQEAAFRQRLVDVLNLCLELWERHTQRGRVELAERSGIWRVTIDDGRLRTRTLDRYLSLDSLPAKPRWREAVRTAYFILAECALESLQRERLESEVRDLLALAGQR